MPKLADSGFTVLAPDLHGLGESAQVTGGYSKSVVAADVRQLVAALGIHDIRLVGIDIGMMVAYAYAAEHPDEVNHLVLAESLIPGFGLEELMNPADGGYWTFGFHMQVDVAEMLTTGKEAAYLGSAWDMFSPVEGLDDRIKADLLGRYTVPGGMRAGFQHYATLLDDASDNREAFTAQLAMPVLVLNGAMGIPQSQTLAGVRRIAADVTADIVPASGHAIGLENPTWVAARLTNFFLADHPQNTGR